MTTNTPPDGAKKPFKRKGTYCNLCLILFITGLTKRKGRDTTEIIDELIKLEKDKHKKMEEQTKKWLEIEEECRQREKKHEEKMLMFGPFMGQMMQMMSDPSSHM